MRIILKFDYYKPLIGKNMEYKTKAKEQVSSFLRENSGSALSLEKICKAVTDYGIGRSTVYRIVSALVASGQVKRISDGRTRHVGYQYIGEGVCREHMHLKCRDCGAIIHLEDSISRDFLEGVRVLKGFSLDGDSLLLGRCVRCVKGERA